MLTHWLHGAASHLFFQAIPKRNALSCSKEGYLGHPHSACHKMDSPGCLILLRCWNCREYRWSSRRDGMQLDWAVDRIYIYRYTAVMTHSCIDCCFDVVIIYVQHALSWWCESAAAEMDASLLYHHVYTACVGAWRIWTRVVVNSYHWSYETHPLNYATTCRNTQTVFIC